MRSVLVEKLIYKSHHLPPMRKTNPFLVEVTDNGKGLPPGTCLDGTTTDMDVIRARSRRHLISNRGSDDPDELQKARTQIEEGLRNLKQNGVGVGLPLSYHLVRMLGGDLRHDTDYVGGTKIFFVVPNKIDNGGEDDVLKSEIISKKSAPPTQITCCS